MNTGTWVLGGIAVLVIVGVGIWAATSRPGTNEVGTGELVSPVAIPIDEVGPAAPLEGENGATVAVETATLAAVGSYRGEGLATRSFDGITFAHTVTANVADPAPGKFYEGWLVMPAIGGPKFFSTGKLEKQAGSYTLRYTASQNYPDHKLVVVTEETAAAGLDGKPEAHVLEGSFK